MEYLHPLERSRQFARYEQMGELGYAAWRGAVAKEIIRGDVPRFVRLCATRAYFYWFGVPDPAGRPANDFFRSLNYGFASIAGLLGLALALKRRVPAAGCLPRRFCCCRWRTTSRPRMRASGIRWSR